MLKLVMRSNLRYEDKFNKTRFVKFLIKMQHQVDELEAHHATVLWLNSGKEWTLRTLPDLVFRLEADKTFSCD